MRFVTSVLFYFKIDGKIKVYWQEIIFLCLPRGCYSSDKNYTRCCCFFQYDIVKTLLVTLPNYVVSYIYRVKTTFNTNVTYWAKCFAINTYERFQSLTWTEKFVYLTRVTIQTLKDFGIHSYITCNAAGVSEIISAACASALDALCSPSAAITFALASRAASASAAIARCNCCGRRTSLL